MNILLTREGDRAMFRKVYPFSPALVQTLIAVSSVLQRERTALKVMLQLLVDQRETLKVGDIVPVGDLFDVVAHGDEAFSQEMAIHFDNAKRLYHQKLLPVLEKQHGRREDLEKLAVRRSQASRLPQRRPAGQDAAALGPGARGRVAAGAQRRAAGRPQPRHDPDADPGQGRPGGPAALPDLGRRAWARSASARRPTRRSPSSSRAWTPRASSSRPRREDNQGNRIRRVRQMLFEQVGIAGRGRVRAVLRASRGRTPSGRASCCSRTSASCPTRRSKMTATDVEAGHRLPLRRSGARTPRRPEQASGVQAVAPGGRQDALLGARVLQPRRSERPRPAGHPGAHPDRRAVRPVLEPPLAAGPTGGEVAAGEPAERAAAAGAEPPRCRLRAGGALTRLARHGARPRAVASSSFRSSRASSPHRRSPPTWPGR